MTGFSFSTDLSTLGLGRPRPGIVQRAVRALADAIDSLLPPPRAGRQRELPPEWFKYPPF